MLRVFVLAFVVSAVSAEFEFLNAEETDVVVKSGDTIVFLGDSITQQGGGKKGYVTHIRKGMDRRFGEGKVKVINAGISGHKVPDLQKRLERDVLSKNPTIVVIYIGINDVWHSQRGRGTPIKKFESGLIDIIGQIQKKKAKVILATPSVIGEKRAGTNSLDKMLSDYSAVSRKVAGQTGAELLDLRKAFIRYLARRNKEDKARGVLTTDGVHLNDAGNGFVAEYMFGALMTKRKPTRLLRHVVMFKFNDDVTAKQIAEVEAAFAALPDKIEQIHSFEMGTNNSPEKLNQGFTHCFLVTFANEKDRDAYLPHPAHRDFVKLIKGKIDKVLVVDYWTGK